MVLLSVVVLRGRLGMVIMGQKKMEYGWMKVIVNGELMK